MLKGEVMADVDLEALSVDDWPVALGASRWTWAVSIGLGEGPLDEASCSVFAIWARGRGYRPFMSLFEGVGEVGVKYFEVSASS
jgi:hypothetical protein